MTRAHRRLLLISHRPLHLHSSNGGSVYALAMFSVDIVSVSDDELVAVVKDHFARELELLRRATPSAESVGVSAASNHETPSFKLFGADYAEVNRTVTSILCLKWILAGDYEAFTRSQPQEARLQPDSFSKLQKMFKQWLTTAYEVYLEMVATMVGDVGKAQSLAEEVKAHGRKASGNHDELLYEAAEAHLIPCLEALDETDRRDMLLGLEFAAKLNIPQLAQGENVPGSLTGVVSFKSEPRAVRFKILEVFLDVAGAAAQTSCKGSLTMDENTYHTFTSTIDALREFIEVRDLTEIECYNKVLDARADLLVRRGMPKKLNVQNKEQRALLRMLCMGRVANAELAHHFQTAFDNLGSNKRKLVRHLNASGMSKDDVAVLPYYAPALFVNVVKAAEGHKGDHERRDWLKTALTELMSLLNRVCSRQGNLCLESGPYVLERNLSFVLKTINSEEFQSDSHALRSLELPWASNGA